MKYNMFIFQYTLLNKTTTRYHRINVTVFEFTGWPKSNVSKVRAYCSASDHLIRKIFSGVCKVSHWFEEYLKIIEIGDYFFE